MLKRDARVQVVVLQNGKYILLKHVSKVENKEFWGLPGGGKEDNESDEEGAIREIKEETGLDVELLPIKIESKPLKEDSIYKRFITYLGYSVNGKAELGYDPEPEDILTYKLSDIKWQGFYDDEGLDYITINHVNGIRKAFEEYKFVKYSEVLVYKIENNKVLYLFLTNDKAGKYTLPKRYNRIGETMEETAIREVKMESGIDCQIEKELGFSICKKNEEAHLTKLYLGRYIKEQKIKKNRGKKWVTSEEIEKMNTYEDIKRFINEINQKIKKCITS